MSLKLYTTGCPKCKVLETKLHAKQVEYEEIKDIDVMKEKGIASLPVLELEDGKILPFLEANKYINTL